MAVKSKEEVETKKVKTNVVDGFHGILKWVDLNIIPLIALPVLSILAADSIRSHITNVSDNTALLLGIAFAAMLAVKSHK